MNPSIVVILSLVTVVTNSYVLQKSSDAPEWTNLVYGYSSHRCYDIPDSFTMCKNIGYDKMILPNFLQHETVSDAVNSSRDWQRLIEFNCHNDSKRFLCSLYAPVCVPDEAVRKIQPCQELCLSVKKSCSPSMLTFGYKWPDILHCEKFPQKNVGLCIRGTESKASPNLGMKLNESLSQHLQGCNCQSFFDPSVVTDRYCSARIVLKAKIAEIISSNNFNVILRLHRKSKIIKGLLVAIPYLKSIVIPCSCHQIRRMEVRKGRWLVMGVIIDRQFTMTSLTKWKKKKKVFKQTIRRLRRFEPQICGTKYQASQKEVSGLNVFGEKMKAKKERRVPSKHV